MNPSNARPSAHASIADGALAAEARELADYLAGQDPLDAEAALWAARRQDGLSADEEAELQAWLAGDPARGARLDQLTGVLGQLDRLPSDDVAALKAALPSRSTPGLPEREAREAQARPALQPTTGHGRTRPRGQGPQDSGRRQWLAAWGRWLPQAAVAGMAALAVGAGWMGWHHWQQQPTFVQGYATARGQQLSATLPDGSTLRLDTATRVEVVLYRHQRVLQLPHGQALFEVKSDATRPFHVIAGATRITVLGTRFSVRHTESGLQSGSVSVVVEEGRVRVARMAHSSVAAAPGAVPPAPEAETIELTAGQGVVANARGHWDALHNHRPTDAFAWRHGRVVLNDTPLGDAVAEFERYMDTGLVVNDPRVAALRLNGSFDLRQLHAFKRALPQALPVRLRQRDDGRTEVVPAQ
jgi:transmembrane sensor